MYLITQDMAEEKYKKTNDYTAKDIQVLEGLEPVRKRPGMYIGSTGIDGLHHLIWELFDNSIDEAMIGHAHNIEVALLPDNKVRVADDGRGIPTDLHPKLKKSALELAATTLHAGGKFDSGAYKVSGGLHGVGLSVVNALSTWMRAEVHRKPDIFVQEYKIGKPTGPVKKIGKTNKSGTIITFQPDMSIFRDIDFDWHTILNHIRQQAYLTKGVKVDVKNERQPIIYISKRQNKEITQTLQHTFYFEGGIVSYVGFLNKNLEAKHKSIFYIAKDVNGIFVEVALQYVEDLQSKELSFANNVHTVEGGMHLTGFRSAITRTLNDYARKNMFLKEKDDNLSGEDIREGLTVVISVKLKDPQFEGQTKTKLGTPDARTAVESVINIEFADWLDRNPNDAKDILEKVILASKARLAAKAARDTVLRKGAMEGLTLPGKLRDCSSKDPTESELFIVEGDSAGGSATQGRSRHTQAILPIKGKILNVEKARIDKMLASQEIRALIIALGTAISEEFDINKLRYHKVIIMTDADSVTSDTSIVVFDKKQNLLRKVKIGNFVERECDNTNDYQVFACNLENKTFSLRNIKKTIRHPLRNQLYEIITRYGYKIKVTADHSVFIFRNGNFITISTKKLKKGDELITPIFTSRLNKDQVFDIRDAIFNSKEASQVSIKLPITNLEQIPEDAWIDLAIETWRKLQSVRKCARISRRTMSGYLGLYHTVLQQWESKIDNVMPRYSMFRNYLNKIDLKPATLLGQAYMYIPLNYLSKNFSQNGSYYINNHSRELKTIFNLDKNLAYLLGWYIGDGCLCYQKKNPNRFSISFGKDKKTYLGRLSNIISAIFFAKPFIDQRNLFSGQLVFHSYEFKMILDKLKLLGKKSYDKFVPSEIFSAKKDIQESFLRGYLESDGCIIVKKYGNKITARLSFTTVAKELAEDIVLLFRQLGIFASISSRVAKDHKRKDGVIISSDRVGYVININGAEQLRNTEKIWKNHKNSRKLSGYLNNLSKLNFGQSPYKKKMIGDSILLPITSIRKIKTQDQFVYDISVDADENFVAGMGNILLHNTDGSHIRTLLLTLFYRYFPKLIENGHIYIAQPPLYRIQKSSKTHYAYNDAEKERFLADFRKTAPEKDKPIKKTKAVKTQGDWRVSDLNGQEIVENGSNAEGNESAENEQEEKIAGVSIQRYKGLGEMNPGQLWETTLDPANRILLQVTIKDAEAADRVFDVLMGSDVLPRKKFIQSHAKSVQNLDI